MTHRESGSQTIPEFSSREEEATWWETHSIPDYLDQLEVVRIRYGLHAFRKVDLLNDLDQSINGPEVDPNTAR